MKNFNVLFIVTQVLALLSHDDYFTEDFDEEKNCKKEEKIKKMMKNEKENCAEKRMGKKFVFLEINF